MQLKRAAGALIRGLVRSNERGGPLAARSVVPDHDFHGSLVVVRKKCGREAADHPAFVTWCEETLDPDRQPGRGRSPA